MLPVVVAWIGCSGPEDSAGGTDTATFEPVAWSEQRAPLNETSPGGRAWRRGIIHLHSHYSHDACDGDPMPGGVPDEACLQSLRNGLCTNAEDFAMITDHPAHAAEQEWEDLLLSRDGDEIVEGLANRITCPDGHTVLTMPGIEDELMPVALDRPVADTAEERDRLYNAWDAEAIEADLAAGAAVLQAHTEGQDFDQLVERQAAGLASVELFNLHAMVDPDIREESLGLDAFSYMDAISPFLTGETEAQPDLAFLAIYEEQDVSLATLDALAAIGPIAATAGTDAHENALPMLLSDDERVDSYRRMMSWFSNILLVDGDTPADHQAAIEAGRLFVAFEILGTPTGFSVRYEDLEMGGTAPLGGTLEVTCPTLAPETPKDGEPPVISVVVLKDGEPWKEGCGSWPIDEAGVYRVRVDIEPWHLAGFLDDQADALIHAYPWLYSNPLRIGL